MTKEGFHGRLHRLMLQYIRSGYELISSFPIEERYALASQGRRAIVSIFLNYVEGYARSRKKVMKHFYEISYGSLCETNAIFYLAVHLGYISREEYLLQHARKEEIAKMLWVTIQKIKQQN